MKKLRMPKGMIRLLVSLCSLIFVVVLISVLNVEKPTDDKRPNKDKGSVGVSDTITKSALQEDVKYYFDSAEVRLEFPSYYEYMDYMSESQYDAYCQMIEETCKNELQENIYEKIVYTIAEDGSYVENSNEFYIFSGGNVFKLYMDCVGEGYLNDNIGEYNGYEVYYSLLDPWGEDGAERYKNATFGTYDGNEISINLEEYRARIKNGDLVVEEIYDGDFLVDYTCYYTYYYVAE